MSAEHVLAHRAVAHGVGAGGARRGHAAERGIGAGIDREEEAGVAEMLVELLARDAGLHGDVEILDADAQHLVHLREVDADAAVERRHMALERGAGAEGNHRHLVLGAELDDLGDFLGRLDKYHAVRRHRRVEGLVLAVLLQDRGRGREPLAEALAQRVDHGAIGRGTVDGGGRQHGIVLGSGVRRAA